MLIDKVIVVTGGAGLLGRGFARAIADQGAIAVVADIDVDAARAVAGDVGGRSEAAALDITRIESVRALIRQLQGRHGRIDAVVNNAYPRNKQYGRALEDVTYADFCENVSQHLGGYFLVAQQFADAFAKQGHGNIVSMSSIYGVIAPRFQIYAGTQMTMPVEYAAIKAGVIHLTRYFARYYQGSNIRVNCLSPGGISDGQDPTFVERYNEFALSKGMLEPRDVHGALVFLLSEMSAFVNGQNLVVDDGWSL